MSLRWRAILSTGLSIVMLIALMWSCTAGLLLANYRQIELQTARDMARRARGSFSHLAQNYAARAADWGVWTDTYDFMANPTDDYREENLNAGSLTRIEIELALYLDTEGRLFEAYGVDLETAEPVPALDALRSIDWRPAAVPRNAKPGDRFTGIIRIGDRVLLYGSSPIFPGDLTGDSRGTLVMGVWFDDHFADALGEEINLPLTVRPGEPTDILEISGALADSHTIAGEFLMRDPLGQPALVGRVTQPARFLERGRVVLVTLLAAMLAVAGLFGVFIYAILGRHVLTPVSDMASTAASIADSGSLTDRVRVGGRDEIARLAGAINRMLDRLAESQRQLTHAKTIAENALHARSAFIASVSHEIRTPLNGLLGFADLLRRRADRGDHALRDEWVRIVHSSGTHLLNVVNDILDMSKIEAGKLDVEPLAFRPRALLHSAVAMLEARARERNITLVLDIDPAVPDAVRTDPTRLRQIVLNLASNAVKFSENAPVRIHAAYHPDPHHPTLTIAVEDRGPGMTGAQLANLFTAFTQTDKSIARRFGGSGLGLAISRALAVALGGDIAVRSTPGEGSTFTLSAPAPLPSPDEPIIEDQTRPDTIDLFASSEAHSLRGRRILVADDADINRKLFELLLRNAGAIVALAENGARALELATHHPFDLIILDMQMPVMSGRSAARAMRAAGIQTPLIALTADASEEERAQWIQAGCSAFLAKPIDPAALLESLAGQLDPGTHGAPDIDPDILPVLRDYAASLPNRLAALRAALNTDDLTTLARLAHAMRGTAGSLGLTSLTAPADALELAALHERTDDARRHLDELDSRAADALAQLARGLAA